MLSEHKVNKHIFKTEDRSAKNRHGNTGKHNNHIRGEKSGKSKLTKEQVLEIKNLINSGISQKEIATKFNISRTTVYDIRKGRSWNE